MKVMRFIVPLALAVAAIAAFLLLRAPKVAVDVVESHVALAFPGATGWKEESGCSDTADTDLCGGEWTHENGQKARVLLVPLIDPSRLASFTKRLRQQTEERGGVVQELDAAQTKVVRLLQPVVRAEDNVRLVNITYVIPGPDHRFLHLLTSLVTEDDQVGADGRLRDLLAFAVWAAPGE